MKGQSGKTVRLTVAQAIVKYISAQYSVADGHRVRMVPAALGIFGHGNVAGLGQALDQYSDDLPFVQGRNEQGLAHAAIGFAKATHRRQTLAVTASIGPGAMNMVTPAALATVNRLPVLLLPGDTYATRAQGPVLQQLERPGEPEVSVNDAFRPISRFFDRISRPEQILTALPQAFRILANPTETGAVVLSLPQDVQSHAFDYPVEFFAENDWVIRRPAPDADEVAEVAAMIAAAKKPMIIAGGGVHYSQATPELEALASATGIPVAETFGGKGAIQNPGPWHCRGIGLEGTPHTNVLVREADLIISVGTRLADFATGSQSLFDNPDVAFASINVTEHDGLKQGATTVVADAKRALAALTNELTDYSVPEAWSDRVSSLMSEWAGIREAALDSSVLFDQSTLEGSEPTDALLTQAQLIGLMQETSRAGDTIVAAAGGPPGDLQKAWDATEGRHCHLEFGFSCMGYEIPAGWGAAMADENRTPIVIIGDGTYMMMNSDIYSTVLSGHKIIVIVTDNGGYAIINRLQNYKGGASFNNLIKDSRVKTPFSVDFAKHAEAMGAYGRRVETLGELDEAMKWAQENDKTTVLTIPSDAYEWTPGDASWDVGVPEISARDSVNEARKDHDAIRAKQRIGV